MGQQQLLLVILVTIIVGIATVVAINTFSSASEQANLDAVRNDMTQIASAAHSYYMKPTMLGGGGNSFQSITFNDITFAADSVTGSGLIAANANGIYTLSGISGSGSDDEFTISAAPSSLDGTIEATVSPNNISIGDYVAN
jgi:Tfp pilus assembly protein PilE